MSCEWRVLHGNAWKYATEFVHELLPYCNQITLILCEHLICVLCSHGGMFLLSVGFQQVLSHIRSMAKNNNSIEQCERMQLQIIE